MPGAITAPRAPMLAKAQIVSQGPSQAPSPAMSFTSPAPMPPIE